MVYQSFWTLTANPDVVRSDLVAKIGRRRGMTKEAVFFSFVLGLGITPLTGTTSRDHMLVDLAALDQPLSPDEMAAIQSML